MLELIDLIERSSATIHADLRAWFGECSAAASWSVVSDFSVGDTGKQNDAYSFVIILKHDGKTEYAEFVRMPDFLAGTLADIKLPQLMFTHRKFPTIFDRVLVNSPNNAVVELLADEERVTSRRIGFGNRLSEAVATARKARET